MSFPSSPSVNDQHVEGGRNYVWTGTVWNLVGNVAAHSHSADAITSGTIAAARLGSGTASSSTFLRGDGTWASAGSTSASDLTSGTLDQSRLDFVPIHPFLLMGG